MSSSPLQPLFEFLSYALSTSERTFKTIPGSAVVVRYVRSSYKNDPWRSLLELLLVIFAARTLLQSRTRARREKNFVKLTPKVRLSKNVSF